MRSYWSWIWILYGLIIISISVACWLLYMRPHLELTRTEKVIFFVLVTHFFGAYLLSKVIDLDKLRSIKESRLILRRLPGIRDSKRYPAVKDHTEVAQRDIYHNLLTMMQDKLTELEPSLDFSQTAKTRRTIEETFESILAEEKMVLKRPEKRRLFEQVVAEIFGLGPIEPLLVDESITEIMVNGAKRVYIRRGGKIYREPTSFESDDHLMRIIDRIVTPLGRRIDESNPYVDARLPDGSRVNAVIPPISLIGPVLTIRKFAHDPITAQQLIEFGTVTSDALIFLKACVLSKINVIISGPVDSGKTTLLNILSQYIPGDERIITIESAAELMLRQENVITLETRPPNFQGRGDVTIQNLVVNALRMLPDRIIVGELHGEEALSAIQAMNYGYYGVMSTIISKYPEEALLKLEILSNLGYVRLKPLSIRRQIADSLELLIQMERLRDGTRKVTHISEIHGMSGDDIAMKDIFFFEETRVSAGKIIRQLWPTGLIPSFMDKIERSGIHLPSALFGQPTNT